MSAIILERLISQHSLFAVPMTNTKPDSHGYTPMDDDADSEADEVCQWCPVRTYTTQRGV